MEITRIGFTPKNGAKVTYLLTEDGAPPEKFIRESKLVPSVACQNALQSLKAHMLLLSEEVEGGTFAADYIKDNTILADSTYKKYTVEGIQLTGEGEQEKVVIFGKKLLTTGKSNPVKNYKQALWNDNTYEFSGNLQLAVQTVVDKFKAYLDGDHQPVPKNEELPFPTKGKKELSDKSEDTVEEEEKIDF